MYRKGETAEMAVKYLVLYINCLSQVKFITSEICANNSKGYV